MTKVLVIDDEKIVRDMMKRYLTINEGFHIIEAETAAEGLSHLKTYAPDCVIIDFMVNDDTGLGVLERMQQMSEKMPPVIFMSGIITSTLREDAMKLGAKYILNKDDLDRDTIHLAISSVLGKA